MKFSRLFGPGKAERLRRRQEAEKSPATLESLQADLIALRARVEKIEALEHKEAERAES